MAELRSGRYAGVLREPGHGFLAGILPSFSLHALVLVGFVVIAQFDGREPPLIDKDIYIVSAVELPKATDLPDKAAAPAQPKPEASGEAPEPPPADNAVLIPEEEPEEEVEPEPEPEEEPTPKPEPEPEPEAPSRDDLLARLEEVSEEPRFETDVDGVEEPEEISWEAFNGASKTAYQRRLEGRLLDNWLPGSRAGKFIPGTGNIDPSLKVVIEFRINDLGAFVKPAIYQGSGDLLFDQSCLSAATRTRRFDPPPESEPRIFMLMCSAEDL